MEIERSHDQNSDWPKTSVKTGGEDGRRGFVATKNSTYINRFSFFLSFLFFFFFPPQIFVRLIPPCPSALNGATSPREWASETCAHIPKTRIFPMPNNLITNHPINNMFTIRPATKPNYCHLPPCSLKDWSDQNTDGPLSTKLPVQYGRPSAKRPRRTCGEGELSPSLLHHNVSN